MDRLSRIPGDKFHLILDAAYTLFGSHGFYETKISDIADAAGIAKGTVYLYFKHKEDLFAAVMRRDFNNFLSQLERGLGECSELNEKLTYIAEHHLRYYFERKHQTKLFFMAPNNDPEMMKLMEEFLDNYMQMIENALRAGMILEPELHAKSYIGMLDRIKMDILFNPVYSEEDLRKNINFASHLFIHGCGEPNKTDRA